MYCVARKGVTGSQTEFSELGEYLARCRRATDLPLALGFGVKSAEDVAAITGKVDIAVVGSETIRVVEKSGVSAVKGFIRSLRAPITVMHLGRVLVEGTFDEVERNAEVREVYLGAET